MTLSRRGPLLFFLLAWCVVYFVNIYLYSTLHYYCGECPHDKLLAGLHNATNNISFALAFLSGIAFGSLALESHSPARALRRVLFIVIIVTPFFLVTDWLRNHEVTSRHGTSDHTLANVILHITLMIPNFFTRFGIGAWGSIAVATWGTERRRSLVVGLIILLVILVINVVTYVSGPVLYRAD